MTAEPRLTIAFTGVDVFRAAWHHGRPGRPTSAAPDPSHGSATVVDGSGTGVVEPSPRDDTRSGVPGKAPAAASSARVLNGTSSPAAPTSTTTRKAVSS